MTLTADIEAVVRAIVALEAIGRPVTTEDKAFVAVHILRSLGWRGPEEVNAGFSCQCPRCKARLASEDKA